MFQLFLGGEFFDYVFIPFETSNFDQFQFQKLYDLDDLYQEEKEKESKSSKQPAASQPAIPLPIQNPAHSAQYI